MQVLTKRLMQEFRFCRGAIFVWFLWCGFAAVAEGEDFSSVNLQGLIVDAETGEELPGRVHIQGEDGRWHFVESLGGDTVRYERLRNGYPQSPEMHTTLSPGPFTASLPEGKYTIRVERGKEYLPVVKQVVATDELQEIQFELKRWVNMSQRGWYSGDTHVHRPLKELPNILLAEDLNVALPLTYWVTDAHALPADGKGNSKVISAQLIEVDETHVIHPVNTEYEIFRVGRHRQTLGAVFVLNHRDPLPVGVPPVKPVANIARKQGALLDLDKHSWPWSLMIVPVMDVDLFELANNHVWQTPFGFKRWTLHTAAPSLGIELDEKGFTEWGWIDFGFKTYYTLVNCGFRMRVSAGTASGVHPVQLGFGRVYVHLPDGFRYEDWIAGLDAGRSFVSTGPMLEVTFNGQDPGATFKHIAYEVPEVRVEGVAESKRPLDRIEIIVNGQIAKTIRPTNVIQSAGGYRSKIDTTVQRGETFWVAVRCFEKHPEQRIRFAHTNPVYVDIADRPLRPRKAEVAYLVQRMEEEIENNRGRLSKEALAEYEKALSIYREIESTARQWEGISLLDITNFNVCTRAAYLSENKAAHRSSCLPDFERLQYFGSGLFDRKISDVDNGITTSTIFLFGFHHFTNDAAEIFIGSAFRAHAFGPFRANFMQSLWLRSKSNDAFFGNLRKNFWESCFQSDRNIRHHKSPRSQIQSGRAFTYSTDTNDDDFCLKQGIHAKAIVMLHGILHRFNAMQISRIELMQTCSIVLGK